MFGDGMVVDDVRAPPVVPAPALAPNPFSSIFDRPMDPSDAATAAVPPPPPPPPVEKSEAEKYLLLAQVPHGTDVLEWWKRRDHNEPADPSIDRPEGLPNLARMAREFLGETGTSAGVERTFSKAGSMHHDLKGAMHDGSLEHALLASKNTE